LERQQAYAPEFCKEFGCRLDATLSFSDEGKSAFHGRHISEGGGMARFLACIEAGRVKPNDILIVENLDRMSRLPLESAEDLLRAILTKGVRIHTRSPWAIYDRATLNDPMQRMAMIFEFTRSHRESRYKQERLSHRWIQNRAKIRTGEYHLALCPGWLRPKRNDAGKVVGYEIIEQHASTVRRIFKLCIEGLGLDGIAKELNRSATPTFGRGAAWGRSSIDKVLYNRSVLGEHQPHSSVVLDGKDFRSTARVATGEPVKDYFPRIIDDKTFERAALAIQKRRVHRSGAGERTASNLFSGLLWDARTGAKLHVADKGHGLQLVSADSVKGLAESVYVPYKIIERGFVAFVDRMPLDMLAPKSNGGLDKEIRELRKEIESLSMQVDKIRSKLRLNTTDVLLDLLVERDAELKDKRLSLENLERQTGTSATMAAKTSLEVLKLMGSAKGEELVRLRQKLRNELRYWLKRVTVLPLRLGSVKAAIVAAELANGERIDFRVADEPIEWPKELDDADVLEFAKWPKVLQRVDWEVLSVRDKGIIEMADAGHPIELIAAEHNIGVSGVSRILIRHGRRRRERSKLGRDRQMTWSQTARGWSRSFAGKRYYVGVGTLKSLYPRLVKSDDEAGSLKAANRWWTEHGPKQ
jgi:DNA invertase Pin-like site-specific DNA recombinase